MKKASLIFYILLVGLTAQAQDTLKVMSFNLRNSKASDGKNSWRHRKKAVLQFIQRSDMDIIGTQEGLQDQIKFLTSRLPSYGFTGCGRDDGQAQGEYAGIFYCKSRFSLEKSGTFWLSEKPGVPGSRSWDAACTRICTWVELKEIKSGRNLFVLNTHFDHQSGLARSKSAELMMHFSDSIAGNAPLILLGDLNAPPSDACIQLLSQPFGNIQLSPCNINGNNTTTYHGWGKEKENNPPIDHIFASGHFKIISTLIHKEKTGNRFVSDHYPLSTRLLLK